MLTTAQKAIIGGGVCVLGILGCYLPWTYTFRNPQTHREEPAGYHFIFNPPAPKQQGSYHGVQIDVARAVIPMVVVCVATVALTLMVGGPRRPPETGPPGGASAHPPGSASSGTDGENKTASGPNPTIYSRTARVCFAVGGVAFLLGHVGLLIGPRVEPAVFAVVAVVWVGVFGGMVLVALRLKSRTGMTGVASLFMAVAGCYLVVPILAIATLPPIDAPFSQVGNAISTKPSSMPRYNFASTDDGDFGEVIANSPLLGKTPEETQKRLATFRKESAVLFGIDPEDPKFNNLLAIEVRRQAVTKFGKDPDSPEVRRHYDAALRTKGVGPQADVPPTPQVQSLPETPQEFLSRRGREYGRLTPGSLEADKHNRETWVEYVQRYSDADPAAPKAQRQYFMAVFREWADGPDRDAVLECFRWHAAGGDALAHDWTDRQRVREAKVRYATGTETVADVARIALFDQAIAKGWLPKTAGSKSDRR